VIEFQSLQINNFLTIGAVELTFEQGMILVKGENLDNSLTRSNGAGKSNLFAAISWCIFGSTPKGKTADEVINYKAEKDCSVILSFVLDNVTYRIERYRKHKKFKNNIRIFINDEDKSQHTTKASQTLIDSIIRIEQDMFNSIIILEQGLKNRFSQLKDTARRETIQNIRNNAIWEKARELNKKELDVARSELSSIESSINSTQHLITSKKQSGREITEKISSLQSSLSSSGSSETISTLESGLETINTEEQQLQEKIQNLRNSIPAFDTQLEQINTELIGLKESYHSKNSRYTIVSSRIDNPITRCNSCHSVLSQATEEELVSLKSERDRLYNELSDLTASGTKKKDELEVIKGKKNAIYSELQNEEQALRSLNQRRMTNLNELQRFRGYEASIRSQISLLEEQLQNIGRDIQAFVEQSVHLSENFKEKELIIQDRLQLDKIFSPKGIQAYLLNKDIEFLNSRLIIYSEYLFSSETIFFDSGINEDSEVSKLNIKLIHNQNGRISDYTDHSGGEQRRVDLAIQLSLRDLVLSVSSVNTNLLVLDEVFEGIDSEGIIHVLEMLRNIIGLTYSTFVITHNEIAYEYFNGEISLLRENDVTTLVLG